jgi:hypothetical protein
MKALFIFTLSLWMFQAGAVAPKERIYPIQSMKPLSPSRVEYQTLSGRKILLNCDQLNFSGTNRESVFTFKNKKDCLYVLSLVQNQKNRGENVSLQQTYNDLKVIVSQ